MPTISGTGAVIYSLRVEGRMGMSTCSHLKGKTKERKPSMANPQGGIVKQEMSVNMSKLMPIDPATKKPTRVKILKLADGKKVRVAQSGEQLDK